MTYTKKIASLFILLACLAGLSVAQTSLTQTTLASAVNGPSFYSGTTSSLSLTVTLAACTGIAAPILPGTPSSIIYVGKEAMGVFTINTTTCVLTVNRGYLGTQAAPHPSGDMVLYGPNYAVTIAQGANPVPSGLFQQDPPQNGTCTPSGTPTTPWINVLTGAQWLCSTITKTWVAGFVNPLNPEAAEVTTAVASAAGLVTPSGPLFHITGALAITGFNIPVGFNATAVGGGQFCVIPDGAFTTTTANNIAIASTAVVNRLLCWSWDATNSKFVPTY